MSETQTDQNCLPSHIPFFAAFSPLAAEELTRWIEERALTAGETIFHQGEQGQELFIIKCGSVKIFLPGEDNREEAVVAILQEGEFFGELSLLDGQPRSASAVTLSETVVLSLQREPFYRALQADFQAAAHVIAVLCQRLRATDVCLAEAAFRDVRERLANYLWEAAEKESEPTEEGLRLKAPLSDAELAQRVGATTERVQAELRVLQRDLIIRWQGATLIVLKPNDLRDMAKGRSAAAVITVPEWLLG